MIIATKCISDAGLRAAKLRAVLVAGIAILSIAPALADASEDCKSSKSTDLKIAACSSLISGGTLVKRDLAQAHLRRGIAYHDKKNFDAAIKDYDTAISVDPSYASAHYERGVTKAAKGDLDGAIADLDASIGLDKSKASSFVKRGLLWRKKGDVNKAIADYTEAIKLDPQDATPYLNRGIAYDKRGDKDLAIQDLSKAIELKPVAAHFYERAVAYIGKGDKRAAATDLNKALELDPQHAAAKARLAAIGGAAVATASPPPAGNAPPPQSAPTPPAATGTAAQTAGMTQAVALESCSQNKDLDLDLRVAGCTALVKFTAAPAKDIARGYVSLATVYAVRGQDDLAMANIEKSLPYNEEAVRNEPSNAALAKIRYSAYQRQALLIYKKGDHNKAAETFEKMRALDPTDEMQTSDWVRAAKAGVIKFNGTSAAFEFPPEEGAGSSAKEKQAQVAAPAAPLSPAPPPDTSSVLSAVQAACKQSDDMPKKLENCTTLINSKNQALKDLSVYFLARAFAYKSSGKSDLALADVESSLRSEPTAIAYGIRGGMNVAKDSAAALRDVEEAFRLAPTDATIIRMRYDAYERDALLAYKNGPRDLAIAKLEKLVKLDPKDALHATQWLAEARAGTIKVDGRKFTIGSTANPTTIEFID